MANLIIVSNRLPVSVKKVNGKLEVYPSSGGLATGLSSYAKVGQNKWIGWPGIVDEELTEADKKTISRELAKHKCVPVFLTRKQHELFYNGYSNSILWPFLHNLPVKEVDEQGKLWRSYREVNQLFAEAVLAVARPESTIWVHDYQLFLLPEMLRQEHPHDTIGFFLHIPFPSSDTFKYLPHAGQLLNGILGADLAGFHTTGYAENFLDSCQEVGVGVAASGQVILADRVVKIADFPMGIDYAKFADATGTREVKKEVRKLRRQHKNRKIILTVDRMDPTKGLVERLEAYREFLKKNTQLHAKVVMIMLAVPSRAEIDAYIELKAKVEALVENINTTYGQATWSPVHYMYTSVPFEYLTALYQVADVAFITPIRDGMNLVAKEYVASKPNKNGVLILSETAGAAQELTDAIIVNPLRRMSMVNALSKSLSMPTRELRHRLSGMQEHLSTNTVYNWAGGFMDSLQEAAPAIPHLTRTLSGKHEQRLLTHFNVARRRLVLLDYDGVLAHFVSDPTKAKPPASLYKLLTKLSADPKTTLVLISGRSRDDLAAWFSDLPIKLVAEHGAVIKRGKTWQKLVALPRGWKRLLLPTLQKYADLTPGAFVEEKDSSLVWHYRKASPYYAQKHIVILKTALRPILKTYGLVMFSGNKILEIKSPAAHKGLVIGRWLKDDPDFIMAIGDDYTDEDMFAALPDDSYTIKVGRGKSIANYRVKSVDDVLLLLKQLR